ncbi:MAG: hypothetical protein FWB72_06470 [Firmicutes bacterium]|nr:hypothetical protein [Bacillota bacterium]
MSKNKTDRFTDQFVEGLGASKGHFCINCIHFKQDLCQLLKKQVTAKFYCSMWSENIF